MSQNAHPGKVLIVGRGLVAEAVAERYARMYPGRPFVPLIVLDEPVRPTTVGPEVFDLPLVWEAPEPDAPKRHPNPYHRTGHARR